MDDSTIMNKQKDRENHGRTVALFMDLKVDKYAPDANPAIPKDASVLRKRLYAITQEMTSMHADLLELLVCFDESEGWRCNGSKHCADWMNSEVGISAQTGWEYLRVGRKLRSLKLLRAFFRVGKVSWSKVRIISRVANESNESILCHAALDASVSDIERLCAEYRLSDEDDTDAENTKAVQQWLSRSLMWTDTGDGSTRITIKLPTEQAQAFLNGIEQSVDHMDTTATAVSQRRADAAVLMAEKSLQSEGREIATADRYQVVVSMDAAELQDSRTSTQQVQSAQPSHFQATQKRATIQNAAPIAKETARRIACDCSISVNRKENGEPTSIGRKSRIWPAAMARAIKDRDQVCVWPGCVQSRHLHIHHIKHWADGGETSVNNGACLCSHHHTLVHEGGYTLVNNEIAAREHRIDTQFFQQLNHKDATQFDFEKSLRKDRESFNTVRNLMPLRYRFSIFDAEGEDIGGGVLHDPFILDKPNDSPRGECRESNGVYQVALA